MALTEPARGQRRPIKARDQIRDQALRLGFDAVGFTSATLGPECRANLQGFIAAGCHGDMGWLAERSDERGNPRALWPEARSVVVVGLSYAPDEDPLSNTGECDTGTVSVYARNRDYHSLIKGRLKTLCQYMVSRFDCAVKVFVDTAPVMEKPLAQRSGIGWQGKHTNLVSRSFGSWLLLGEIYTSLDISPDPHGSDHCGSCTRCLDICPTNAFISAHKLDARRCISYLTIEHHGPIPESLRPLMGNHIYGCDDCLAVCPWNKFAKPTQHAALMGRDDLKKPDLSALADLTDQEFRVLFSGSPIKRIGRDRFIRNVLIAIGNSGNRSLADVAVRLCADGDPTVAEAARWAAARLLSSQTYDS